MRQDDVGDGETLICRTVGMNYRRGIASSRESLFCQFLLLLDLQQIKIHIDEWVCAAMCGGRFNGPGP